MSPREVFALRDYLGADLKGRTISDARQVVSLTDILGADLPRRPARRTLRAVGAAGRGGSADIRHCDDGARRRCAADAAVSARSQRRLPSSPDGRRRHRCRGYRSSGAVGGRGNRAGRDRRRARKCGRQGADRAGDGMADADIGHLGCAEDRQPYPGGTDRRDRRRTARRGAAPPVWATFYDIRRYGGLQIFLRAIIGGGSMVLSEPGEPLADYIARLRAAGVTHISGTPSHWRKLLMSGSAAGFSPRYVRLSGEIADQAVLDGLSRAFPGGLDRSRLCVDRGRRRLCRQ